MKKVICSNSSYSNLSYILNKLRTDITDIVDEVVRNYLGDDGADAITSDYYVVEVHKYDHTYARIEVRAEVDYEGLEDLNDALDEYVSKFDQDAYFEPVDPGITECYINYRKVAAGLGIRNIMSSNSININSNNDIGYSSFRDPRLQPPDPLDTVMEDPEIKIISIPLDVIVIVDEDGSWEYEDDSYSWAESGSSKDGDWYSNRDDIRIADKYDVVDWVDELIEVYMPAIPGQYQITADIVLKVELSGVEAYYDLYKDGSYDKTIYSDDADISFLPEESSVKNFRFTRLD